MYESYKEELVRIAKRAYSDGIFTGTSGNLSLRIDETKFCISASGLDYVNMKPADVMVIDYSGMIIEGNHQPSVEWSIHSTVLCTRNDANGIVHTHSPYATTFAVLHEDIPIILFEMNASIGPNGIPCTPIAEPGSKKLADITANALKNNNAILMGSHGSIAVGSTLEIAYKRAVYTEDAAKIYHHAKLLGSPMIISNDILANSPLHHK